MAQPIYDETLYLDTDTYVCGDLMALFALLNRFDWGSSIAPARTDPTDVNLLGDILSPLPPSFPMPNSGVVVLRRSQRMADFFENWMEWYRFYISVATARGSTYFNDQTACREALYQSDLHVSSLPAEYNCRLHYPGQLHGAVHIVHSHCSNLKLGASTVNKFSSMRIHWVTNGFLYVRNRDGFIVRN